METSKDFTKFEAWKKAMDLAVIIHDLTTTFPPEERYGVTAQIRKAAVSVAANIAEGFGRYTYPDKRHKYVQAWGELVEVLTFLYFSERVHYISKSTLDEFVSEYEQVHKMLNALITKMDALESSPSLSPRS
jgi:four helix bundle protein